MSEDNSRENKVLTIKEVAELLKVSVQTVKNYIYNGKLRSFKTPGGHHRFLESEISKKIEQLMTAEEAPEEVTALIVKAMARAIEEREGPLYLGHSERVAKWCRLIAMELDLKDEKVELLALAGLLHDLGKINIDGKILSKPGTLTQEEYQEIRKHSQFGEEIVKDVDYLQIYAPIIRHHHEWFNGHGYPDSLKGGDIPFDAQIIGVAEAFDIINNKFKMKKDEDHMQKTLTELKNGEDIQFSPHLVWIMKKIAVKEA